MEDQITKGLVGRMKSLQTVEHNSDDTITVPEMKLHEKSFYKKSESILVYLSLSTKIAHEERSVRVEVQLNSK